MQVNLRPESTGVRLTENVVGTNSSVSSSASLAKRSPFLSELPKFSTLIDTVVDTGAQVEDNLLTISKILLTDYETNIETSCTKVLKDSKLDNLIESLQKVHFLLSSKERELTRQKEPVRRIYSRNISKTSLNLSTITEGLNSTRDAIDQCLNIKSNIVSTKDVCVDYIKDFKGICAGTVANSAGAIEPDLKLVSNKLAGASIVLQKSGVALKVPSMEDVVNTVTDTISNGLSSVVSTVESTIDSVVSGVKSVVSSVTSILPSMPELPPVPSSVPEGLKSPYGAVALFTPAVPKAPTSLVHPDKMVNVAKQLGSKNLSEGCLGTLASTASDIAGQVGSIASSVGDTVNRISGEIESKFDSLAGAVTDLATSMDISTLLDSTVGEFSETINSGLSFVSDSINSVKDSISGVIDPIYAEIEKELNIATELLNVGDEVIGKWFDTSETIGIAKDAILDMDEKINLKCLQSAKDTVDSFIGLSEDTKNVMTSLKNLATVEF